MRRTRLLISILAIGSVGIAACGDNERSSTSAHPTTPGADDAEANAMVNAIAATLDAIDEEGAITFTADEATCLSQRVVASIGVDRLVELGADAGDDLTSLTWTPDERGIVFDHLASCVDIEAQLTALFARDPAVPPEVAACVGESYAASDVLPEALFSVEPDDDLSQRIDEALGTAFASCS